MKFDKEKMRLEIKIQMMKLSCRKQLNFRNYAEIIRYL